MKFLTPIAVGLILGALAWSMSMGQPTEAAIQTISGGNYQWFGRLDENRTLMVIKGKDGYCYQVLESRQGSGGVALLLLNRNTPCAGY